MTRRLERLAAYLVLLLIGIIAIAPFVYLLILSFKSRIDILTGAEASDHVRHRLEEAVARVEQRSVVPGGDDTLVREQAATR